jgi:tetratricopeptide (TPR) repeat protein
MIIKYLANTKLVVLLGFTLVFVGCSESKNPSKEESILKEAIQPVGETYTPITLGIVILELEESFENPNAPQKEVVASQLVTFYGDYYRLFPNDKNTADMIFKAGNQCVNLKKFDEALEWYNTIDVRYSNYQKRPEALYLQGFVYDTYKNEFGNAEEKYKRLIKLYPNHILTPQAEQSIQNLGLSDVEIIRKFEKKEKN